MKVKIIIVIMSILFVLLFGVFVVDLISEN